jgi:hypothetical protein
MIDDSNEKIRRRAYEIWEAEGRQHGSHEAHWRRAEAELTQEPGEKAAGRRPAAAAARTKKPPTRKGKAE